MGKEKLSQYVAINEYFFLLLQMTCKRNYLNPINKSLEIKPFTNIPLSSQTPIHLINDGNSSFLDFGGVSMNLSAFTNGRPVFVISILFENISIIGPVPLIENS